MKHDAVKKAEKKMGKMGVQKVHLQSENRKKFIKRKTNKTGLDWF